jgi:hypothetical protein
MAPSATELIVTPVPKAGGAEPIVEHVHGGLDKTPLEAISHGPLVQRGT